ncbi:uncharacterized protein DS421_1g24440 [Arachis hypogaea]|nr:uncharacterized protein DS421_1g24440 [Arachis hypogaea]
MMQRLNSGNYRNCGTVTLVFLRFVRNCIAHLDMRQKRQLEQKIPPWEFILTKVSLVERRPENYEAVTVCPLSSVSSLVRFAEEPQMFAVEFSDGCPIHGQCPILVLPRLTMPGHRIDPPCGSVYLQYAAAKDAVAEGGSIPGSRAKLWGRIRDSKSSSRISSFATPSPKAAATVMGFIACLHRLLASRSAASHVMSFPAAVGRIMGLLRNGSEGVASEAAGLVAAVIVVGLVMLILKPTSVSPLLSMAVVLRQVAGLKRRLFALFGHLTESVRETVAVIMRSIAEEDAIAVESMREASVRDAALLRHLLHSFFLPAGERCEVSRQLVALWADSYQPALELLS